MISGASRASAMSSLAWSSLQLERAKSSANDHNFRSTHHKLQQLHLVFLPMRFPTNLSGFDTHQPHLPLGMQQGRRRCLKSEMERNSPQSPMRSWWFLVTTHENVKRFPRKLLVPRSFNALGTYPPQKPSRHHPGVIWCA